MHFYNESPPTQGKSCASMGTGAQCASFFMMESKAIRCTYGRSTNAQTHKRIALLLYDQLYFEAALEWGRRKKEAAVTSYPAILIQYYVCYD